MASQVQSQIDLNRQLSREIEILLKQREISVQRQQLELEKTKRLYEKSLDQVKTVYEKSHDQIQKDIMMMETEAKKRKKSMGKRNIEKIKEIEKEMIEQLYTQREMDQTSKYQNNSINQNSK